MATAAAQAPVPRRRLGITLCQLAVPALAIPSAIGVAKFFSVADGASHWTAQGIIAAVGFELMNVGLSILDVRRPELHPVVQRVRFWSVSTAIALNVIAHYGARVPGLDRLDVVGGLLALVASVPLAILYVALAGLLHTISAGEHAEADECAGLAADLASARAELANRTRELARVAAELATAREAAHEGSQGLAAELAMAREELTEARDELVMAREATARAEREARRLTREADELRRELDRRGDRSRESLVREAQSLQAEHGWGASEIARHLGWPESTVRGWLPAARAASAAD